jgi:sorbitol-specific phosphotransferase system component IIBC
MVRHLILIFSLLFISCASRKVDVTKQKIETKTDSISVVRIDSTSQIKKNVYITENTSELEIKPLNDSLPIVIDGTSYFNAVLRYKKSNKVLVDTSKIKVSKNVLKQVSKSKEETKNIKEKTVDKKANYFVYLWLLLIPIGMYLYRQLKNKILL